MAIAFIQSRSVDSGTVASANLAFNSNNTAGNLIVVGMRIGSTGNTITVTDSNGNTYTQARLQTRGADHESAIYYAMNVAGGANTVTITLGGAQTIRFSIHEYSGVATSSALDQTNSDDEAGTALPDSGNVTTTTNDQLLFGFVSIEPTSVVHLIAPVGVSADAVAASGNVTVTPPTTVTDDILILAVTTRDNVAISLPAGWTIYQEANNGATLRATVAWKRCVGAEGAFTVTHTAGDSIAAAVVAIRGCDRTSNPINTSVLTGNGSSSTCTAATISSTVDYCMLLFSMHDSDNGASSAQSSANLGAMSEQFEVTTGLGSDSAVSSAVTHQITQGASGASTGTFSLGPDVNSGSNTFLAPWYTFRETVSQKIGSADRIVSTTGTYNAFFDMISGSSGWACLIATFKAAAGGATPRSLGLLGVGT